MTLKTLIRIAEFVFGASGFLVLVVSLTSARPDYHISSDTISRPVFATVPFDGALEVEGKALKRNIAETMVLIRNEGAKPLTPKDLRPDGKIEIRFNGEVAAQKVESVTGFAGDVVAAAENNVIRLSSSSFDPDSAIVLRVLWTSLYAKPDEPVVSALGEGARSLQFRSAHDTAKLAAMACLFFLTPIAALGLILRARRIREDKSEAVANRYIFGAIGLVVLSSALTTTLLFSLPGEEPAMFSDFRKAHAPAMMEP